MKWPNKIFLLFLILSLFSVPVSSQRADFQTITFTGKVVGVSDGDTIKVMREGRGVEVRLAGIDCPKRGQAFGTRAKRFTYDLAFGKEVNVWVKTTDRYGRIVGEVILPDRMNLKYRLVDGCWGHIFICRLGSL